MPCEYSTRALITLAAFRGLTNVAMKKEVVVFTGSQYNPDVGSAIEHSRVLTLQLEEMQAKQSGVRN